MKTFNFKLIEQRKELFRFIDCYNGECTVHLNNTVTHNGEVIARIVFEDI